MQCQPFFVRSLPQRQLIEQVNVDGDLLPHAWQKLVLPAVASDKREFPGSEFFLQGYRENYSDPGNGLRSADGCVDCAPNTSARMRFPAASSIASADELLKIATTTGSTMVMVTHDVDEAVLLSDCIVIMTNGPSATSLRCACRARANGSRGRQICCT